MASGKHCFVIMPFSKTKGKRTAKYWNDFYSNFIKPAVENLGYTCERSSAKPGNIMKAIVKELVNSDVVLAVLTDYNPNVLYELGARHSLKHGTIMMLQRGQNIPFDIAQYGVLFYQKAAGIPKFQENLRVFIQKIGSGGPDSPILDFKPEEMSPDDTTSEKLLEEINKRSLAARRQVIYNDLVKNTFGPLLRYKLETAYDYPISRLKLYYDLSSLKENPDYDEAKFHWEQDLKDIGIDPELIERQVNALNKDVVEYFTSQIPKVVRAAIAGKLTAFELIGIPPKNQISIPYLIKQLETDWIENTNAYMRTDELDKDTHQYVLEGVIIATTSPPQDETMNKIINSLKKDSSIRIAIQAFKERRAAILDDVMKMNREIKRIINRISKRLYKTTCRMCDDNVLAGG